MSLNHWIHYNMKSMYIVCVEVLVDFNSKDNRSRARSIALRVMYLLWTSESSKDCQSCLRQVHRLWQPSLAQTRSWRVPVHFGDNDRPSLGWPESYFRYHDCCWVDWLLQAPTPALRRALQQLMLIRNLLLLMRHRVAGIPPAWMPPCSRYSEVLIIANKVRIQVSFARTHQRLPPQTMPLTIGVFSTVTVLFFSWLFSVKEGGLASRLRRITPLGLAPVDIYACFRPCSWVRNDFNELSSTACSISKFVASQSDSDMALYWYIW